MIHLNLLFSLNQRFEVFECKIPCSLFKNPNIHHIVDESIRNGQILVLGLEDNILVLEDHKLMFNESVIQPYYCEEKDFFLNLKT